MSTLLKKIFKDLFKKRSIVFLGRAGLNCYYLGEKFFVDSEMLVGPPSDIVIYTERIYLLKNGKEWPVDETTRAGVLAFLKQDLERQKIKYELS